MNLCFSNLPFPFDEFEKHPEALLVFGLASLLVQFAVGIYLHFCRHPRFPSLRSVPWLFHEGNASGNSLRNLWTRMAGARRCLRVTVTGTEVWIRPFFPFNIFPTYSDLFHRIPRAAIVGVERSPSRLRPGLLLSFQGARGKLCRFQLRLHNPDGFLVALNTPRNPPPLPE